MKGKSAPVVEIYRLNTDLLMNCLSGVSGADGTRRVLLGTNSMAFLTAHVIDARYFALTLIGCSIPNPLTDVLGSIQSIEEVQQMPGLDELRGFWIDVSKHLDGRLETVSAELLQAASPQEFPVSDRSVLGALAFLAQHESYHLGQLAFIRKGLGYPAMAYARSNNMDS
jgi:hypothetical protein